MNLVDAITSLFNEEGSMEMDQVWDKIKKGLKDGAAVSMEKIEEYTRVGKLKIEEMAARRKIERNYADIGERVFDLISQGKGSDAENDLTVKKAVDNINSLNDELNAISEKIKTAGEEARTARAEKNSSGDDEITGV